MSPTMDDKPDPYSLEGVKNRQPARFPWLTIGLAVAALLLAVLVLTPLPEKMRRKVGLVKEKPAPKPPKPEKVIVKEVVEKRVELRPTYFQGDLDTRISKTSMGIDLKTILTQKTGKLASAERVADGTYEASFTITVQRPKPATSLEQLESLNPKLSKILPGLPELIQTAKVSPFYKKLYDNKAARIKSRVSRLRKLPTKHNYFDCQTMLEMEHPETKRKVFLFQGDMDVVSDGSDGDRLATMPDKIVNSAYYQPSTSYSWPKTGTTENPLIAGWRRQLAKAKEKGDTREIKRLKLGISDMKKRSFLIAEYDPFIVIPTDVIRDRESAWGPNIGDYAVVIYKDKIYPAIVGDAGPLHKVGEASLRMAQTINPRANSNYRPVSDVDVTYIVFPRTSAEPWAAPNYDNWHRECGKLLGEIGGLGSGVTLYRWKNTLPPKGE